METRNETLEYTGELNEKAKTALVKSFEEFGSGAKNTGKILPVPLGMKLTPLGLHVCNETVRKAVIKLGHSYKKKSLHASEQERPRCQGKTQKLEKTYGGERHKSSGLSGRKRSKHQYDATLCQSMEKPESSR